MSYQITFEWMDLPKTPNQLLGAHWTVRAGHARQWHHYVKLAIRNRMPVAPLPQAHLTLTRFSSREPDTDNLRGSFKPVIDALKKCGVIVDDRRENIGEPIVRWQKAPPKKGKVQVIVQEVNFSEFVTIDAMGIPT